MWSARTNLCEPCDLYTLLNNTKVLNTGRYERNLQHEWKKPELCSCKLIIQQEQMEGKNEMCWNKRMGGYRLEITGLGCYGIEGF